MKREITIFYKKTNFNLYQGLFEREFLITSPDIILNQDNIDFLYSFYLAKNMRRFRSFFKKLYPDDELTFIQVRNLRSQYIYCWNYLRDVKICIELRYYLIRFQKNFLL